MNVRTEKIGPTEAQRYLNTAHENQRNINMRRVLAYAEDMLNGDWRASSDAIAFDDGGRLVNGQHRLAAIIHSGTTAEFIVCRMINESAFVVMDQGQKRSNRQVLRAYGKTTGNASKSAEVANLLAKYPVISEQCSKVKLCRAFDYYSPFITRDYANSAIRGYVVTLRSCVVLAAHSGCSEKRLARIPYIIETFMPERPEDYTIMAWVKYYDRNLKDNAGRNSSFWQSWFISQRVVKAVVDGVRLTTLKNTEKTFFEPKIL